MALGAGKELESFVGVDSEIDIDESSFFASKLLKQHTNAKLEFLKIDTQKDEFISNKNLFDLIHVDADHSFSGCTNDLLLSLSLSRVGTIIVVDDSLYAPVRAACEMVKRLYSESLRAKYVTNFRGHCLILVDRCFPELLKRESRQAVLTQIDHFFPKRRVNELLANYSSIKLRLGEGILTCNALAEELIDSLDDYLSEGVKSLKQSIKTYEFPESCSDNSIQFDNAFASESFPSKDRINKNIFDFRFFDFRDFVRTGSIELDVCKRILHLLLKLHRVHATLNRAPLGKFFSYFLKEGNKHFTYLHRRLYTKQSSQVKTNTIDFYTLEYIYGKNGRIETFEGHSLTIVLMDALVNLVASLSRELETQYWMQYWKLETNRTWLEIVLKEENFLLSPIPFPVRPQEEYRRFYSFQTPHNSSGVSVNVGQIDEYDLYQQLTHNPTDCMFRLATSIGHIKLLLLLLQERHPGETIRWLDFGCGIGYLANKIKFEGDFVGVDVAESLIDYANSTKHSNRYIYKIGGFNEAREAINGEKFHLITATELIEHVFDPLSFITQMSQHTCDSVYASSPFNEAVPYQPSQEHLWSFNLEAYKRLFETSGMNITFSSVMNIGEFIGEGHDWLSVIATVGKPFRLFPNKR
ncbi:MAG: methyltransferase domain-containing protein [Leptolyngbyaceae cyanobacterium SL_1_1]|nr:methyltransferase domain-containing protein [Leptolyngbyaceae cyanobacterium SL_1_1]